MLLTFASVYRIKRIASKQSGDLPITSIGGVSKGNRPESRVALGI
jgi:hypothetical protein